MRLLAFLDGTLADPDQAHVHVDDLGLMRGDGIFETVLVADGEPRELGFHLDRLARSAATLELPEPDRQAWERVVRLVIDNWQGSSEFVLKVIVTRGREGDPDAVPTAFALGMEIGEKIMRARADGIAVVTLERGIDPGLMERAPWLLLGAKSLSYAVNMAAGREAARRGADDVIFVANDGSVLEGPTSNVIMVRDGVLYTTPPTMGILKGTTQGAVFRGAERHGWSTKVEPFQASELRSADAVLLASSVRKLTRVHTLDGTPLPDSKALHAKLEAAYESEYATR